MSNYVPYIVGGYMYIRTYVHIHIYIPEYIGTIEHDCIPLNRDGGIGGAIEPSW